MWGVEAAWALHVLGRCSCSVGWPTASAESHVWSSGAVMVVQGKAGTTLWLQRHPSRTACCPLSKASSAWPHVLLSSCLACTGYPVLVCWA
jgi:hypothetical protein